MSEATTLFDETWASIELDEDLYPEDAVKGAAYVFLDRAYLFLERAADRRLRVRVRAKRGGDTRAIAGELENEALTQAYRRRIAADKQAFLEGVAYRAIAGAAGPPGLDDLLAMDIGAETAFDDPLGIAMSWEEKYAKKKTEKTAGEPAAAGEPARAEPAPGTTAPAEGSPAAAASAAVPAPSAEVPAGESGAKGPGSA